MMEHIEYVFRMTNTHHVLPANYGGCADVGISLKCTLEHEESQKEKRPQHYWEMVLHYSGICHVYIFMLSLWKEVTT